MSRFLYLTACVYLGVCVYILKARPGAAEPMPVATVPAPAAPAPSHAGAPEVNPSAGSGSEWFAQMRTRCNPVEVDVGMRDFPPPNNFDGLAYQAACYALAGRIDQARGVIRSLPGNQRANAAEVLLSIADPVADAGDDRAAGPMMRLVLEFNSESYIALYHAGMSEYALGERGLAVDHLQHFLRVYGSEDGWRGRAKEVLREMGA